MKGSSPLMRALKPSTMPLILIISAVRPGDHGLCREPEFLYNVTGNTFTAKSAD